VREEGRGGVSEGGGEGEGWSPRGLVNLSFVAYSGGRGGREGEGGKGSSKGKEGRMTLSGKVWNCVSSGVKGEASDGGKELFRGFCAPTGLRGRN
jgi:hypothetical protein